MPCQVERPGKRQVGENPFRLESQVHTTLLLGTDPKLFNLIDKNHVPSNEWALTLNYLTSQIKIVFLLDG